MFEYDVFHCEISRIRLLVVQGVASVYKTSLMGNKTYSLLLVYYRVIVLKIIKNRFRIDNYS